MYLFKPVVSAVHMFWLRVNPKDNMGCQQLETWFLFQYFDYRVYEKIMEKLKEIGQSVTGMKRKVANWAKGVALQGNINIEQGYVLLW